MNKLKLTGFAAVMVASLATAGGARAQAYPTQDLHLITAYPAGSSSDTIVRFIGEKLRPLAGRTVLVENKPGANANIATEYAARAKPDGHTIYIHAGSALAANMHLFQKPPVDVAKAIQMVGTINKQAFMMGIAADKPWKTLADVTAAMKAKGDKASYASYSATGTIMGELYKQKTGVQATEVVYRIGADTLNELRGGQLDYGMYDPPFAMAQVRNGTMRIVAIATKDRMQTAPELPTFEEQGVTGIDLLGWFSMMVPAGTPKPIITQLNTWLNRVLALPETKAFLNGFGSDVWASTPEEAQARLLQDIKDWGEYVRAAKIKPLG
jgi:tripartite-type tricarboxylate transporter receptor subunit TctC